MVTAFPLSSWQQTAVLTGHSIFSTQLAPEARDHFLLHYWLTFLAGFAGGPLSALLIMNPAKAPINLLSSNQAGGIWTLCWWLMTYSPLAPLLTSLFAFKPIKMVCKACVAYMRANLIIARVTLAVALFPGIHLAPILLGTIAACGGKCTYDLVRYFYGLATGPCEFTTPSYSFRSAFLGSALFYLAVLCPLTACVAAVPAAKALVTLFVVHSLTSDLLERPLDWTALLLGAVLRLGGIPWPAGVPLTAVAAAPTTAAKRATAPQDAGTPAASAVQQQQRVHTPSGASMPAAVHVTAAKPVTVSAASSVVEDDGVASDVIVSLISTCSSSDPPKGSGGGAGWTKVVSKAPAKKTAAARAATAHVKRAL